MNRLEQDKNIRVYISYKQDFEPNPCQVILYDDSTTVDEVARRIYEVAEHAVTMDGRYLAGSPGDKYKHRR